MGKSGWQGTVMRSAGGRNSRAWSGDVAHRENAGGQGAPNERVRGRKFRGCTVRSSLGRWTAFRKTERLEGGESQRGVCAAINVASSRAGEFPRVGDRR